jgi:micrococcal nuclease
MKQENKIILTILLAALIIASSIFFSIRFTGKVVNPEYNSKPSINNNLIGMHIVTKIIDGDTVIVEGENVRLLGMDTDERGYPCYSSAKERLEELVLNKEVRLEKDQTDKDQYQRHLRYIFLDDENINLKLVEEGLAVARFYPEDTKYKNEIINAETQARENKRGCKWNGEKQTKPKEITEDNDWSKLTPEDEELDIIGACNAGNYIGKEKIIEGRIVDTYRSKTNTIFLNFDKPYPNHCFVAVIFSSDIYKFPENPEDYYYGKSARIRGEIKEYEGKPEIILSNVKQIEIA